MDSGRRHLPDLANEEETLAVWCDVPLVAASSYIVTAKQFMGAPTRNVGSI